MNINVTNSSKPSFSPSLVAPKPREATTTAPIAKPAEPSPASRAAEATSGFDRGGAAPTHAAPPASLGHGGVPSSTIANMLALRGGASVKNADAMKTEFKATYHTPVVGNAEVNGRKVQLLVGDMDQQSAAKTDHLKGFRRIALPDIYMDGIYHPEKMALRFPQEVSFITAMERSPAGIIPRAGMNVKAGETIEATFDPELTKEYQKDSTDKTSVVYSFTRESMQGEETKVPVFVSSGRHGLSVSVGAVGEEVTNAVLTFRGFESLEMP